MDNNLQLEQQALQGLRELRLQPPLRKLEQYLQLKLERLKEEVLASPVDGATLHKLLGAAQGLRELVDDLYSTIIVPSDEEGQ